MAAHPDSSGGLRRLAQRLNPFVRKHSHESLRRQVAELGQQLAETTRLLGRLRDRVLQNTQIDAVNDRGVRLLMYTDDSLYQWIPAEAKQYPLSPADYPADQPQRDYPPADAADLFRRETVSGNLTSVLLAHYWSVGLDPGVVDIGASYGAEVIYTAKFVRDGGRRGVVYAFEPGIAGTLLDYNIELNGVVGRIRVVRSAVSNVTGPVLIFGERGHSENNRLLNRTPDQEDFAYVVPATTLDRYLEREAAESDFIVKIDTQGHEPEVIAGMTRLLPRGVQTLIVEFTPLFLATRIAPRDFLAQLARHGTILDIGQSGLVANLEPDGYPPATDRDGIERLMARTEARQYGWTDLLVVPHSMPKREELLRSLTDRHAARRAA